MKPDINQDLAIESFTQSKHYGFMLFNYKRTLNIICILLFFAGIVAMLLPGRDSGPHQLRSMAEISITGHMLVFFLGAYLFYAFNPEIAAKSLHSQVLLLLLLTFCAGTILEGLQFFIPGRSASFRDMIANTTGAMVFLSIKNLRVTYRHFLLYLLVISISSVLLWPFVRAFTDEFIANRQFPLLAGFETPFEATRFIRGSGRFSISDQYAFQGTRSLKVVLGTQTYSGIALEYMAGRWQGYSQLQFAVYNPHETKITIHTRIHDTHHAKLDKMIYADRFNRIFTISPGTWTIIQIPLADIKKAPRTRQMDMNNIDNIGFFVAREPEPVTIYIDDIRLK